ncbi:MAG: hypothetical protein RM368_10745 [Nostoc sp. DedSLP03]|uniref:hypothetical protein n=1 Tax=Nostoc sp. DedSLP03 TaxID=3075400 RepID=UPI002AD3FDB5|nr:hypothetical protein [Nostoc sp. DedSLP03]MDZ7965440.1 hypothetical protein [Nostoc sp. DedSLP03]
MHDCDIIVAVRNLDGTIDSRYIQPLNDFLYKHPSPEIVKRLRGEELFDLLANDLGIVRVECEKLKLNYIKPGQRKDVRPEVMILLGRLAEALIVRRCNQDAKKNRVWASYARRGNQVSSLDNYIAIGTGFASTKNNILYKTKYSPNDTQRDIIWVKKDEPMKELSMGTKRNGGYPVGLQIKVSRNKDSVFNNLSNKTYAVPVVYFDLNRDFTKVAEKLRQETLLFAENNWKIGEDLICGRDVDPELHDNLLQFLPLIELLLKGKIELADLLEEIPEFDTAIKSRFIETTGIGLQLHQQKKQQIEILTLPI